MLYRSLDPTRFPTVYARVYRGLNEEEVTGLGLRLNALDEASLKMTDYQKVMVIRRILKSNGGNLKEVYRALHISEVRL